jgi:hypothetical protein
MISRSSAVSTTPRNLFLLASLLSSGFVSSAINDGVRKSISGSIGYPQSSSLSTSSFGGGSSSSQPPSYYFPGNEGGLNDNNGRGNLQQQRPYEYGENLNRLAYVDLLLLNYFC